MSNSRCNYNYDWTNIIILGERKARCNCGIEIAYTGTINFYQNNEELSIRELVAKLDFQHKLIEKFKSLTLEEVTKLMALEENNDDELLRASKNEEAARALLQERKIAFWKAERAWAEAWAALVVEQNKKKN